MNGSMRGRDFLRGWFSQRTAKERLWLYTFSLGFFGLFGVSSLQAQESPYARVSTDKSPAIINPEAITSNQFGPWTFGITKEEAATKGNCDTTTYKTSSAFGRPIKEPYLFCTVWFPWKDPQYAHKTHSLWLYFKDNRLDRIEFQLGEVQTRAQAAPLFAQALSFWGQLRPGPTTLYDGIQAARPFAATTVTDIEQSLTKLAQKNNENSRVFLRAPSKFPEAELVFFEDSVYFVQKRPIPRVTLLPTSITEHHIGPWRMGMPKATVLQNPACKEKESDAQRKITYVICDAQLDGIGPHIVQLWFKSDQLYNLEFRTHLEEKWESESAAERFIAQGIPFLQNLRGRYPIHIERYSQGEEDTWLEGPVTPSFLYKQAASVTKTLRVCVSTPYFISLYINPKDKTVTFGMLAPSIENELILLEPRMIKPGVVGPWYRGMSAQEAAKPPGCKAVQLPSSKEPFPESYEFSCDIALPGQTELGLIHLWFLHNQLASASIRVSRFHSKDSTSLRLYADNALRFFQGIGPHHSLMAWSKNHGFDEPLSAKTDATWAGHVVQTYLQAKTGTRDEVQVKFQEEAYKTFGLQLTHTEALWILQEMTAEKREGTNWLVDAKPEPQILLDSSDLSADHIGLWRLGDGIEKISANPACQEKERSAQEEKYFQCNVWLQKLGSCRAGLYFHKKRLRHVALKIYRKEPHMRDATILQTGKKIWFWFQKITKMSPFRILVKTETQVLWQTKHFSFDLFLQSWTRNPPKPPSPALALQTKASFVSVIPLTMPRLLLSFFPQDQDNPPVISLNLVDMAAGYGAPTLGSTSFHNKGLGPWEVGMSPTQALAQPGCQKAATEPTGDPKVLFANCPVQFVTLWERSEVRFWFENQKLRDISLFVFVGPLHNPDSFHEQVAFVLQQLQQLSPQTPLTAFVKEKGQRLYQTAPITADWVVSKNKEQIQKRGNDIGKEIYIQFKDKTIHPHLFLKIDAESGIRFTYLSNPNE